MEVLNPKTVSQIELYAGQSRRRWETDHNFAPVIHPVLVGYIYNDRLEVTPVYQTDNCLFASRHADGQRVDWSMEGIPFTRFEDGGNRWNFSCSV